MEEDKGGTIHFITTSTFYRRRDCSSAMEEMLCMQKFSGFIACIYRWVGKIPIRNFGELLTVLGYKDPFGWRQLVFSIENCVASKICWSRERQDLLKKTFLCPEQDEELREQMGSGGRLLSPVPKLGLFNLAWIKQWSTPPISPLWSLPLVASSSPAFPSP